MDEKHEHEDDWAPMTPQEAEERMRRLYKRRDEDPEWLERVKARAERLRGGPDPLLGDIARRIPLDPETGEPLEAETPVSEPVVPVRKGVYLFGQNTSSKEIVDFLRDKVRPAISVEPQEPPKPEE